MSTPLTTTDPAELANLARCFSSCVPVGLHMAMRTQQLNNVAVVVTNPVCSTPRAPTINAIPTNDTTAQVTWKSLPNSGSFITGWIVSWGTTSGGPYPNSSGVLPMVPRVYTATGLTSGTQYFFIVTAVTNIAGCTSNSPERSATTTGTAPPAGNGLLNGLVSYWVLAAGPSPDLEDANPSTLTGGTINANGGVIANGPYVGLNGTLHVGYSITPAPANLRLGVGASFTCQVWIKPNAVQGNVIATILSQYTGLAGTSAHIAFILAGNIKFNGYCTDATQQSFVVAANPGNAAWHHLIVGYDSPNKLLFAQLDGATRVTQATTADLNSVAAAFDFGKSAEDGDECNTAVNEAGFWNRVLSTTDVTNLYNAGAGLAFGSFTV